MGDILAAIGLVWTPWSVAGAIIAGLVIGFGLSWPITNPLWSSRTATRVQVAIFVSIMTAWIVTVLYVTTIIAAVAVGDVGFTRVVSRYTLFLFAALVSGAGCWLALRIRGTW
jgi:hypothetical protein